MLTIDIEKQLVNNDPTHNLDVVVIKSASSSLIQSLLKLTLVTPDRGSTDVEAVERISPTLPESVNAYGCEDYTQAYEKIDAALSKPRAALATRTTLADKNYLQNKLAGLLTDNTVFVHDVQTAVQNSAVLNPDDCVVTVRNIRAAIALLAHYDVVESFTSAEGVAQIASIVGISTDTLSRMATDLKILRKTGNSTGTKYFVSSDFDSMLLRLLCQESKFDGLRNETDVLLERLDKLDLFPNED